LKAAVAALIAVIGSIIVVKFNLSNY